MFYSHFLEEKLWSDYFVALQAAIPAHTLCYWLMTPNDDSVLYTIAEAVRALLTKGLQTLSRIHFTNILEKVEPQEIIDLSGIIPRLLEMLDNAKLRYSSLCILKGLSESSTYLLFKN
jgi:hypothetical protein